MLKHPSKQYLLQRCSPIVNGCWIWNRPPMHDGYGQCGVRIDGKMRHMQAHRYSYEAFVGHIPAGMYVMHKCDIRACVNPEHLSIGNHWDNMNDMSQKGRSRNRFTSVMVAV